MIDHDFHAHGNEHDKAIWNSLKRRARGNTMTIDLTEDERVLLIISLGMAAGVFARDGMEEQMHKTALLAAKFQAQNDTPAAPEEKQ